MDPDRDGCGLLWCSPVAPNDGFHAAEITSLASEVMLRNGFEPAISMTVLTDRTLSCVISLTYDRDIPGEDEKAMACYYELLDRLSRAGYHSYRLSVGSMSAMGDNRGYQDVLQAFKKALDPNGVLSPGRYVSARTDSPAAARPVEKQRTRVS